MEYYEQLGVSPTASPAEIRRSYLALAREFHPDRLSAASPAARAQASARMATVNAAWSVLSDRDRRARYDAAWKRPGSGSGATVRDLSDTWSAYDDTDDDFDPHLLDDTPSGAKPLRRAVTMLPAGLVVSGVLVMGLGFMIGLVELMGLGILLFMFGVMAFLMIPLVALANSSRADRLD